MAGGLSPRVLLLALLWLLHWLPLACWRPGPWPGWLLHWLAGSRRRMALRNLEICFPESPTRPSARPWRASTSAGWAAASSSAACCGYAARAAEAADPRRGRHRPAERSERPVMWLVPHFVALDVAGASVMLFQKRRRRPDLPAAEQPGDGRGDPRRPPPAPGQRVDRPRSDSPCPVMRVRSARAPASSTCPTWISALRDAAFVPFFGVPAPRCWRRRAWRGC